jgi:hypothetical protein
LHSYSVIDFPLFQVTFGGLFSVPDFFDELSSGLIVVVIGLPSLVEQGGALMALFMGVVVMHDCLIVLFGAEDAEI